MPTGDHKRLEALRRITVKRGATKAEAATAKRLAEELEAKLEKKHRGHRCEGQTAALPEPPAARKKRLWSVWLDWTLQRAHRLYRIALALYFLLTPVLLLTDVFGGNAMERQLDSLMLVKFGLMVLLGPFAILVIVPITFARWWLRTEPDTRLCKARAWVIENALIGVLVIALGISPAITGDLNMAVYAALLVTASVLAAISRIFLAWWRTWS
jgi:hypothetical protein